MPDTDRDERLIRAAIQYVNQCSADIVHQCWPDLDYDAIIAAADRPTQCLTVEQWRARS